MPQFSFMVTNAEGQKYTGTLMASDVQAAMKALAEKELVVTRIQAVSDKKLSDRLLDLVGLRRKHSLRGEALISFTQQLATMLDAGLTVKQAVDTMRVDVSDPQIQQLLLTMSNQLGAGRSFSEVLAENVEIFSRQYRAIVAAGESGGTLAQALSTLAELLEKEDSLTRKVRSAFYYPTFVVVLAVVILVLMLILVVPRYASFYQALGGTLPLPTRILMAVGHFLEAGLPYLLFGIVLVNAALIHAMRTQRGRLLRDRLKLFLPVVGPLLHMLAVARFSRTLSSLLSSGIPIVDAIRFSTETMDNAALEKDLEGAGTSVLEGEAIVNSLRNSGAFTEMTLTMVSVGEQSGKMDRLLAKVATYYEERVETALRSLAGLIEPVVILFVGVVVGAMIFALVLPVFRLMNLFMR